MTRLTSRPRFVFCTCLLTVVLILAGFAVHRFVELTSHLSLFVAQALEAQIGRNVRSGRIHVDRTGHFVARDLVIDERRSFGGGAFVTIDRAEGQFNLPLLFLQRDAVAALTSIDIYSPRVILIRSALGEWNFQDLIARRNRSITPGVFNGRVGIHDGMIEVIDERSRIARAGHPTINRLTGVNGTLDPLGGRNFALQAFGAGSLAPGGLRVSGRFDANTVSGTVHADARRLDLAYWLRALLPPRTAWGIDRAWADVSGSIGLRKGKLIAQTTDARARLWGGQVTLAALRRPVQGITAGVHLLGTSLTGTAAGRIDGVPLAVSGRVRDLRHARVDLSGSSGMFPIERLSSLVTALPPARWPSITGPVRLAARMTGPANDLDLTARLQSPQLVHPRLVARDIDATARVRHGVLTGSVRAHQPRGGRVSADVIYPLRGAVRTWTASGRFDSIDLVDLSPPSSPVIAGRATGTFHMTGAGSRVSGIADASLPSGAYGPYRVTGATVHVASLNGRDWTFRGTSRQLSGRGISVSAIAAAGMANRAGVALQSMRAGAFGGTVETSGTIGARGKLDLNVRAREVDLHQAVATAGQSDARGRASFNGRLFGTTTAPAAAGHLAVANGRLGGVPFDLLSGDVQASRTGVAIADGTLRSGTAAAQIAGRATLEPHGLGPMTVDARFSGLTGRSVEGFHLRPSQRLSLPSSLRAAVASGTIHLAGRPSSLSVGVNRLLLRLPDGSARVQGTAVLGQHGSANFTTHLDRVPASVVAGLKWAGRPIFNVPAPAAHARITGDLALRGPFSALEGSGQLALGPLSIMLTPTNPFVVREASGQVSIHRGAIRLANLTLQAEGESLTGTGSADMTGRFQLRLAGQQLPLERLQPFVRQFATVAGTGSLEVTLTGRPGHLIADVRVNAGPLLVNGERFDRLTGSLAWNDAVLQISGLAAERGTGVMRVPEGRFDFRRGLLSVRLAAMSFDASTLYHIVERSPIVNTPSGDAMTRILTQIPAVTGGLIDGTLQLDGPLDNLMARAQFTADALAFSTMALDSVTVDATWSPDTAYVREMVADAPGLHVSASGSFRSGDAVDLRARLSRTDLQAMFAFVRAVPALARSRTVSQALRTVSAVRSGISGTLDAGLLVYGTTADPQGQLTVNAANLRVGPQTFDTATGTFALRGRRMYVENLQIAGGDAVITASGSGGLGGDLDFNLNLYNLSAQLVAPWAGLPPDLRGTVDVVSVAVSGTQDQPRLLASIDGHDLGTARFQIHHLRAFGISADGSRLDLGRVEVSQRSPASGGTDLTAVITGTLPFRFSPLSVPSTGTVALHVDFGSQSLGILTAFTHEVQSADGTVTGSMDVAGTLVRPKLAGQLIVQNGTLGLAGFRNRFVNLNGRVSMLGTQVATVALDGASDRGGTFKLSGEVAFDRRTPSQLSLVVQELGLSGINVTGMFGERFDGRLNVNASAKGPIGHPVIHGTVQTHALSIALPDTPLPATATPATLFPINAVFDNLQFVAGQDVEIRRGTFMGQIAGRMAINGDVSRPREPYVDGRFLVHNARVRVATKLFRIQDGGVIDVSYRPPEDPRIHVDLEAMTHMTLYSVHAQERRSYDITVNLRGPIENPQLDFRADPPELSRQQILAGLGYEAQIQAILAGGSGSDRAFRQGVAEAFTGMFVPSLLEPLDFAVIRALGLEDFELSYDYNSPLQVQFTKRLFDRFFFLYRRQLSGVRPTYMTKLYYRVTPRINLSYTTDDRHANLFALEGRFRF